MLSQMLLVMWCKTWPTGCVNFGMSVGAAGSLGLMALLVVAAVICSTKVGLLA
jgi:hypothetical protein